MVEPTICPAGYFCPNGTDTFKNYPCQRGFFGNKTQLSSHDQCHPCTPGQYCDWEAMTVPRGLCAVGYFCEERAISATPVNMSEGGGPCPEGYFCESGYSRPLPCPKGMYGPRERIGRVEECSFCDGGKSAWRERPFFIIRSLELFFEKKLFAVFILHNNYFQNISPTMVDNYRPFRIELLSSNESTCWSSNITVSIRNILILPYFLTLDHF